VTAGVAFTMDVMFCDYISYLATIEFISHMHVRTAINCVFSVNVSILLAKIST
jgi:hypothetical protein